MANETVLGISSKRMAQYTDMAISNCVGNSCICGDQMSTNETVKRRCPKCGNTSLLTERRPNGNSSCPSCGWKGKTSDADAAKPEASQVREFPIPQSFSNLIESEMRRPRRDGLTTKLAELASAIGYRFVSANKRQQQTLKAEGIDSVSAQSEFKGTKGGFIWDHFAVSSACHEMLSTFTLAIGALGKLQAENESLNAHNSGLNYAVEFRDEEIAKLTKQVEILNKGLEKISIYQSHDSILNAVFEIARQAIAQSAALDKQTEETE